VVLGVWLAAYFELCKLDFEDILWSLFENWLTVALHDTEALFFSSNMVLPSLDFSHVRWTNDD
jgi:hypothetical protein